VTASPAAVTVPEVSRNVLLISHHFPPDSEVGAKRIAGLARYLPEYGIRPTVLTVDESYYDSCDRSFPLPEGLELIRTKRLPNPLQWYRRFVSSNHKHKKHASEAPAGPAKPRLGVRRHLLTLLDTPDRCWGWYFPAIRAAREILAKQRFSAIISSGPPWTCHLIGRHIRKAIGIPWIADFRDSWTFDSWRPELNLPKWRESLDRRWEEKCMRAADRVLSTTEGMRRTFIERYPTLSAAKFLTLTNGFNGCTSGPMPAPHPDQLLFLHTGKLYGGRRIDTFCQAFAELVRAGRIDPARARVLFLGETDPGFVETASQFAPDLVQDGKLEFHPMVDWDIAQRTLRQADVLLIFQGNHRLAIPAKLYEYFSAGKPILAIVKQGELSNMIESTQSGFWADPDDPADIRNKILASFELRNRPPQHIEELRKRFHYRFLAERLAAYIREMV
jgi:glycosyltransferase involved in cell wall biosynthesis